MHAHPAPFLWTVSPSPREGRAPTLFERAREAHHLLADLRAPVVSEERRVLAPEPRVKLALAPPGVVDPASSPARRSGQRPDVGGVALGARRGGCTRPRCNRAPREPWPRVPTSAPCLQGPGGGERRPWPARPLPRCGNGRASLFLRSAGPALSRKARGRACEPAALHPFFKK